MWHMDVTETIQNFICDLLTNPPGIPESMDSWFLGRVVMVLEPAHVKPNWEMLVRMPGASE